MAISQDNPSFTRSDRGREYWARAPYNFVPLPERILSVSEAEIPPQNAYSHHTGWIDCLLTTESPLYTRAAMDPDFFKSDDADKTFQDLTSEQQAKRAESFHIEAQKPVIPGSSLRGMIRSLVEIASYGKMKWVGGDQIFFRAVGDTTSLGKAYRRRMLGSKNGADIPLVEAGYLRFEEGKYIIHAAKRINGTQYFRIEEVSAQASLPALKPMSVTATRRDGSTYRKPNRPAYQWRRDEVWFQPTIPQAYPHTQRTLYYGKVTSFLTSAPPKQDGWERGWFLATGWIPSDRAGKHLHWIVTAPDPKGETVDVPEDDIKAYHDGGGISQEIEKQRFDVLSAAQTLPDGCPCFFVRWQDSNGEQRVSLGHTAMFRLPYEHTALDYVPAALRDPDVTDLAEAVFGYVAESKAEKRGARAGRVFISDATYVSRPEGQPLFLSNNFFTPKVLGSPKLTTFQHYLVQDGDHGHHPLSKDRLANYDTPSSETEIRGHKLYWHKHTSVRRSAIEETDRQRIQDSPKQYTGIRPVASQVTFKFRVYFDNLRTEELGAILWVLMLPGSQDVKRRHKLGMGKPLGLGSVRIHDVRLTLTDRSAKVEGTQPVGRYAALFNGPAWQMGASAGDPTDYAGAFEEFVAQKLGVGNSATDYRGLPRIQMLVKMLEFPGPDDRLTRYMQVEPQNEYKERPVLPDPLHLEQPARDELGTLRVGDIRTGVVVRIISPGALVEIGTDVDALLRRQAWEGADIQQGAVLQVRITDVDVAQQRVGLGLAPVPTGRNPAQPARPGNAKPQSGPPQPTAAQTAHDAPVQELSGKVTELDTNKRRRGKVRDEAGNVYEFGLDAIQGNYPGTGKSVKFQVQNGKVIKLWRAL